MMVLIAEDDAVQAHLLSRLIRDDPGLTPYVAETGKQALACLSDHPNEIVLAILDIGLPDISGLTLLETIRTRYSDIPVIMLTASNKAEDAVHAIKAGAVDYLIKPSSPERIRLTVKNALKLTYLHREVVRLRDQNQVEGVRFSDLVGHDGGLAPIIKTARKLTQTDIPVLITGETGTGKDLCARAIHYEGPRRSQNFVAVNCGAIPAQLIESVLFGHEKGAFTGATESTRGKFREADGGTIFLDEVGELPLEAQTRLLRVLQQKEVEPVGAAQPVSINARVIAATNKDLQFEVKAGRFREDLYYRLNVVQIEMPPLRERRQDIPDLIVRFILDFCNRHEMRPPAISKPAIKALISRPWPGNIRELQNMIHKALVLSDADIISPEDLDVSDIDFAPEKPSYKAHDDFEPQPFAVFEEDMIRKTLIHFDYNVTQAANSLDIAKSTFYKKLKRYDIALPR